MNKKSFLKLLENALSPSLSSDKVLEQINYYDDYISNEIKSGKKEDDVITELGDPNLIAKTIIQVNGTSDDNVLNNDNQYSNEYNNSNNTNNKPKYTTIYSKSGLGCALIFIVLLIAFMFILRLLGFVIGGTFIFFSPFSIIILIMILFSIFNNKNR